MSSSIGQFWQKYRISVLVLAVVSLVAYGSSAFTPSLLGDEWGILNGHISVQGIACPDWPTPRPFGHCLLWFVHGVVGLNIYAYHAVAIIASFLSATLLLILLEQLLPSWVTFNSAVATLFLVYPADMTRTWLAGNIVYAVALYLAAACFLAAFWRYGRWMTWIAGMAILLLAVGTYEVPLGVNLACVDQIAQPHHGRIEGDQGVVEVEQGEAHQQAPVIWAGSAPRSALHTRMASARSRSTRVRGRSLAP